MNFTYLSTYRIIKENQCQKFIISCPPARIASISAWCRGRKSASTLSGFQAMLGSRYRVSGCLSRFNQGRLAMLVNQYSAKFVRPPNPTAQHLRCYAHLEGDIREVLPFLNAVLKGHQFCLDPPSLTLKFQAKLITLTAHEIAINMVEDQTEAHDILEWLKKEINATWERRGEIAPSFEVAAPPRVLNVLRLLPRTNCRACGQPTCMVFAVQVCQGALKLDACPSLDQGNLERLREYLEQFHLPD
jgi:ArsR family metal-binding transcriptional regulator